MELVRRNIHMNRQKGKAVSQMTLDDDYNIPDNMPDAGMIIQEKGSIEIGEVRVEAGRVKVKGALNFFVLYMEEGPESGLHSVQGQIPFEEMMNVEDAKDGDSLHIWVGPAMTMSLPPQTSALIVVGNVPADYKVPEFYKVTGTDKTVMPAIYPAPERTEVNLPVAGGETLTIPVSAQFTPWLTRQIVTVDDLVPGSQILTWKDKDGKVEKVLLLPYGYRGYYTVDSKGEVTVNGEKLSVNAKLSGPGLLPLRAVAEAVNYEVCWVSGQGATVKEGDKEIFSVLPGAGTAKRPNAEDGDWELLAPCVTEKGITYLAASDLSLLLNLYFYSA